MQARHMAAAIALLAVLVVGAKAETYPARPVTIITPFAAGSVTDAAARLIAQSLQESLGQPFVVENRAGAGGCSPPPPSRVRPPTPRADRPHLRDFRR